MSDLPEEYKFDNLDKKILAKISADAKVSYQEMGKEFVVSSGTIHVRINKMKKAGIIKGNKTVIDYNRLGLKCCAFVGINCNYAGDYSVVMDRLRELPQVAEVYYTTGQYSLFIKVLTGTIQELHLLLIEKIQNMKEIRSTETFISLDNPIHRDPSIS